MKFVITGASGFLGVDICKELLYQGHQINAVCRKESKGLDNLPKDERLSIVWADLNHLNDIRIYHLEVLANKDLLNVLF